MTRFASRLAAGIEPYVPGEQPKDKKYIKLNTNESPYPPSRRVIEAVTAAAEDLRLYPDPDATAVREAVAAYYNAELGMSGKDALQAGNVFVGNGSDEVLALIFPAFLKGKKVAAADITYSFYPVLASLFEVDYITIPLRDDFSLDLADYTQKGAAGAGAMLVCNPNAPTGLALSQDEIISILEANPERLVVVDEAYVDFGAQTSVSLVSRYDNLLVVQTMSKSRQLAGMRVGFAVGNSELIGSLNAVKNCFNSYPADRLGIAAGKAAMEDRNYFAETRAKIIATRGKTVSDLESIGFRIVPSSANFIFVQPPALGISGETDAAYMFRKLREEGILVRYFARPRIDNMLRITIGTGAEMAALSAAARKIISEA